MHLPDGGNIPVSDEYQYLGVNFCTSADVFVKQEEHVQQASVRAANVLRRRSLWGCNWLVLVCELWKAIHVPVKHFPMLPSACQLQHASVVTGSMRGWASGAGVPWTSRD